MPSETSSFADRVRIERQAAGLSRLELARRAGISQVGVSHIETGIIRDPRGSTIVRLARGLGIPADSLLSTLIQA